MPRAFKTFSSWGEKDDRVTFVQKVQTPDSRVHLCHECPVWQPAFVQVALTASAHLATEGDSLWFRPDFRLGFAGPDCKVTSDNEVCMRGSGFMRQSETL